MTFGGRFCTGRGTPEGDHCCWVAGERCQFLEEYTVPGRHYVCGLRRALGSWEAVHADPGYQANVQVHWDVLAESQRAEGNPVTIISCGAWQPNPGQCCRE